MQFQRPPSWLVAFIVVGIAGISGWRASEAADHRLIRWQLFAELTPVAVTNCTMRRFGDAHDGGYPLCANLLGGVRSGYSYGIANTDNWGCEVSEALGVPMHEYDCYDLRAPACAAGRAIFHSECVGPAAMTDDGRSFDSIEHQLERNGDGRNHVVMKMDIEGDEWDSLAATPDAVLQRVDQLVIEFHYTDDERYAAVLRRLHQFFHLVHVHFNNFTCRPGIAPFPSWAYETLWVNKSLATVDASRSMADFSVDAPNNPDNPDCQPVRPLRDK